jgi:xanthine dehydrogenase accessory factor
MMEPRIRIEIIATRGSTPRDRGAVCLVSRASIEGTIGGGQVEYLAIEKARAMLEAPFFEPMIEVYPLNPFIGQCCGGEMTLAFTLIDGATLPLDMAPLPPHVTIFGQGSVGAALQKSLSLLPLTLLIADDRPDYPGCSCDSALESAPKGSLFIITTHAHALDYRLAEEVLITKAPLYCGMVGSETKARRFRQSFLRKHVSAPFLLNFHSPMGEKIDDKRPEIIAALVCAQIVKLAFSKAGVLDHAVA